MASKNPTIKSLSKKDWNDILQRIMTSYNDLSKSINPVEFFEINLTPAQTKTLTCFIEEEEMNMTELSQHLGVAKPTMTVMADLLTEAKMLKRKRDLIDQRIIIALLTVSGRATLKKLMNIRRKETKKTLMRLNQEETNTFLTSIEMVAQLLTKGRQVKRERRSQRRKLYSSSAYSPINQIITA
jgi:DNA-binding MarR family transcriptional regulator